MGRSYWVIVWTFLTRGLPIAFIQIAALRLLDIWAEDADDGSALRFFCPWLKDSSWITGAFFGTFLGSALTCLVTLVLGTLTKGSARRCSMCRALLTLSLAGLTSGAVNMAHWLICRSKALFLLGASGALSLSCLNGALCMGLLTIGNIVKTCRESRCRPVLVPLFAIGFAVVWALTHCASMARCDAAQLYPNFVSALLVIIVFAVRLFALWDLAHGWGLSIKQEAVAPSMTELVPLPTS